MDDLTESLASVLCKRCAKGEPRTRLTCTLPSAVGKYVWVHNNPKTGVEKGCMASEVLEVVLGQDTALAVRDQIILKQQTLKEVLALFKTSQTLHLSHVIKYINHVIKFLKEVK